MTSGKKTNKDDKGWVIKKCEELIRSFNQVTHSIDTHCHEHLGDVTKPNVKPENIFIQQVVYGWHREKAVIDAFISNFYADNAACVLRVDSVMYSIFAYMAIYRLREMGFAKFKEFTSTQDPTKMYNFVNYLSNKENLSSNLRADWMRVRDLEYTEKTLIRNVEKFIPDAVNFCDELQLQAVGVAAAQAAKEEEKKKGTAGLGQVTKKASTIPVSPRIHKPRPPNLPEPEKIEQSFTASDVPGYLDMTSLEAIVKEKQEKLDAERERVKQKYGPQYEFHFQELKAGRDIEEVRREIEESKEKELEFNKSFVHPPPDFGKMKAKVRLNASAIYREDALFRKQQEKDARLLKQYEEELRDQTEFLIWQKRMKEKDKAEQIELIAQRKEGIKQSHIECAEAIAKQKEDNRMHAERLRREAEMIKMQKELEIEERRLQNQVIVQYVTEERDTKPKEAVEKVLSEKAEKGKSLREELEAKRIEKERQDRIEEEMKADRIRQLRAENEVHKKHVVVFDPTEIKGAGFLDEMSYLEMKIRLRNEQSRAQREEEDRRQRILEEKEKRQKDLDERARTLMKVRQVKAETNKFYIQRKKEAEIREKEAIEKARQEAAIKLEAELREKREEKRREAAALRAEEERVRRQQLYLGAAAGLVEETREEQLLKAKERELRVAQHAARADARLLEKTLEHDKQNRKLLAKKEKISKEEIAAQKEKLALEEKKRSIARLREEVLAKRDMAETGRIQHATTRSVIIEHNPYASTISNESVQNARMYTTKLMTMKTKS